MYKIKTEKTRLFIRCWLSWDIYWLPTIQSEYHKKNESFLCNFSVEKEDKSYKGSELCLQLHFLTLTLDLTIWWNIEEKI